MDYFKIAKKNFEEKHCPFCEKEQKQLLDESDFFYVTVARAPYTQDHLLVVSKRHVTLREELSAQEFSDGNQLLQKWNKKLHQKHRNINILLRDGYAFENIGKSIDHLHFHLIPSVHIGRKRTENQERIYFSEEKLDQEILRIKKQFT